MPNEISQAFSKPIISTFSAFRHYLSFPIEATQRGRGESMGGMSVGQRYRFIEKEPLGGQERTSCPSGPSKKENHPLKISLVGFTASPPETHLNLLKPWVCRGPPRPPKLLSGTH